jgi:hypothetical protein
MGVVRFRVGSGELRCGYLAGSSVLDLGTRQPHEALATLSETLSAERPVHDRRDVTLLCPVDPETIVRLDGCYEHDVTDPHLGEPASARCRASGWPRPSH